jgi:hypothetical protein
MFVTKREILLNRMAETASISYLSMVPDAAEVRKEGFINPTD